MIKTLIKGPTLIEPPKPKPYYSCDECTHYESTRVGPVHSNSYYKVCRHPDFEMPKLFNNGARGMRGTPGRSTKTPQWCLFLIEEK